VTEIGGYHKQSPLIFEERRNNLPIVVLLALGQLTNHDRQNPEVRPAAKDLCYERELKLQTVLLLIDLKRHHFENPSSAQLFIQVLVYD
jgi:hypothetical protein